MGAICLGLIYTTVSSDVGTHIRKLICLSFTQADILWRGSVHRQRCNLQSQEENKGD